MFRKTAKFALVVTLIFTPLSIRSVSANSDCLEINDPTCTDHNLFNGYWWHHKWWVPFFPSRDSWFTPAPEWFYGNATFYAGYFTMESNAKVRGLSLDGYVDGVALESPADIGLHVWLKRPGYGWEGPYLVVDCAQSVDIYPIIDNFKEGLEVSRKTAERWGMITPSPGNDVLKWRMDDVQVSKIDPRYLTGEPINYPEWWLTNAKPGTIRDLDTPVYKYPPQWLINGQWVTFLQPMPPLTAIQVPVSRLDREFFAGR